MTYFDAARTSDSLAIREWLWVGKTQFLACLFGVALLGGIVMSRYWLPDVALSRSDLLFLYALLLQVGMIAFRFEHKEEVGVILVFHLLATLMEWFKTSPAIGSWSYPVDDVIFRIYQVPLFAGFLYASVGSYLARSWRLFGVRFQHYPPVWMTVVLAVLAYLNFFTHHFVFDIRWILIGASVLMFGRTRVFFKTGDRFRNCPLLAVLASVSLAIWGAENIGTFAQAWIYPGQEDGWEMVSFQKFWAWYLLMLLSFVLVSLVRFRDSRVG